MYVISMNDVYYPMLYKDKAKAIKEMAEMFEEHYGSGYFEGTESVDELKEILVMYNCWVERWDIIE